MTDRGRTTVLITGATGLIGGRLIEALRADASLRVRAASRVNRPWPADVEGVVAGEREDAVARACDGVDVVVNLAAMPEAMCAADPSGALRVNAGGTLALASAAARAGVARFIQLSTAKVYGSNLAGTVTEDTCTRPTSHYAITHRTSEDYAALHGNAVIFRAANGFGAPTSGSPPQAWSVIVNDFCRQVAATGRIALDSDGSAWRDFVPMPDVVEAIRAAIGALGAGTYNLGSGRSTRIRDMARHVAALAGELLGDAVEVNVPPTESSHGQEPPPLDFRTDRLKAAGVTASSSADSEIVRTLRVALTTFRSNSHA